MRFRDDVPIGNRLDILQSAIRQRERAITIILNRRAEMDYDLGQLENDLKELREQFKVLVAERAEE